MRFRKIDRYLLLLAALFVAAILMRWDLPGEAAVPEIYRAVIHQPLLLPAAKIASRDSGQEMEKLRAELATIRDENARLHEQLSARDQLGRYFDEIEWRSRPKAIPAWVLSVEADVYRRFFDIDRGRDHGVGPGMPVVCGTVLLGRVHHAGRRYASVRRIDDAGFRIEVAVRLAEENAPGVAGGNGRGGMVLRFAKVTRPYTLDAAVFTSSYDEQIPQGLLVGYVDRIEDPDRDRVDQVTLRPALALGRLAHVWVLPYKRRERR